jgi:hypothetical protein
MEDQGRDYLSNFNTRINAAQLPNATASLVLGIISIVGSLCYGVVGVICGTIGLVLANRDRKLYQANPELYSSASYGSSNAGRICSIIGLVIGSLFLLLFLFIVIWNIQRAGNVF